MSLHASLFVHDVLLQMCTLPLVVMHSPVGGVLFFCRRSTICLSMLFTFLPPVVHPLSFTLISADVLLFMATIRLQLYFCLWVYTLLPPVTHPSTVVQFAVGSHSFIS